MFVLAETPGTVDGGAPEIDYGSRRHEDHDCKYILMSLY